MVSMFLQMAAVESSRQDERSGDDYVLLSKMKEKTRVLLERAAPPTCLQVDEHRESLKEMEEQIKQALGSHHTTLPAFSFH